MKHSRIIILSLVGFLFFLTAIVRAQLSSGGVPLSFPHTLKSDEVSIVRVDPPDVRALHQEDLINPVPYRVAINLPVNIGFEDFSLTTLPGGKTVYRITVSAAGATGITLYFDRFFIPGGGKVFVYNLQRTQLLGAFTEANNNRSSTFATSFIYNDQVTVEYNGFAGMSAPELHISEIAYAYRGADNGDGINTGFGAAGKCEVNINCDEGLAWQIQKRGVARIQVKRGVQTLFCTGSLVNNTLNDGKPYILTADHCGRLSTDIDISQWIFYFGYESKKCSNPTSEPYLRSITGATRIAHGGDGGSAGSDFFLVLLNQDIPDTFNVYYNGWSRSETPSAIGVSIHHPEGDIMKVSTYKTPLQASFWPGDTKLAHWRVVWDGTFNGHGTTEPGSSGSPLFDSQGRIVGTLTGGDSSCDSAYLNQPDYYGQFFYHWDLNGVDSVQQLKPWLDPTGSNTMTINGWALSARDKQPSRTLNLFPNPVKDFLTIPLPSANKPLSIAICDLSGNSLRRFSTHGSESVLRINVSDLAPGLYFLNIQSPETSMTGKFVKISP